MRISAMPLIKLKLPDLILAVAGLTGAIFNSNLSIWGFVIWIPANVGLVILNYRRGYYEQAVLFTAYTATSINGIFRFMA
jgi:nicotinamide riboside transporter PnuC